MKIVIDLQVAQTASKNRGIGRYSLSLVKAIVRNANEHKIIIVLSDLFPDTIEPIRSTFNGILPQENILVWSALDGVAGIQRDVDYRRHAVELLRECFISSLNPDIVYILSMFEGFGDDAVTSIGRFSSIPTAITLHNLIPYIHQKPYFEDKNYKSWYLKKLEFFKKADLWLSNSESSRQEGLKYLELPEYKCVNISADADPQFTKTDISNIKKEQLLTKYGLSKSFVMSVGGVDFNKNIERLIQAFSLLPKDVSSANKLAIVFPVSEHDRVRLLKLAKDCQLSSEQLVLTGFVPEDDLVALYTLCRVFVFPSLHEGFGLSALEAMRCGAPVIGSNTFSLPEVIGLDQAMFDPYNIDAISHAIERVLKDEVFRNNLIEHGKQQANKFSWNDTARRALKAMEKLHTIYTSKLMQEKKQFRPRLAYVSPLPPECTGIADYSAELLPAFAEYYEIEVIVAQKNVTNSWIIENCTVRSVEWFLENNENYNRILYHFGNYGFHHHILQLLKDVPGVVVLRDFYLSGVLAHMEMQGSHPNEWSKALYQSHGYCAVHQKFTSLEWQDVEKNYPSNLSIIQNSLGIIFNSNYSYQSAYRWYDKEDALLSSCSLVRNTDVDINKIDARKILGFSQDKFIVCSFGMINPLKLHHRLISCWANSKLAENKDCHLVFVGEVNQDNYGKDIQTTIQNNNRNRSISITGWLDKECYEHYLMAADVGVQLRTKSRGETSAAVFDCMNFGLATIVNANGSLCELDNKSVMMLADHFTDQELIHALEYLWEDHELRLKLGKLARQSVLDKYNPQYCAAQYYDKIERFYSSYHSDWHALPQKIATYTSLKLNDTELFLLAGAIAKNHPPILQQRQLLVDVSELAIHDSKTGIQRVVRNILRNWLLNPPSGYRVEPIYAGIGQSYRYARKFTLAFLGCPQDILEDELIEYFPGDVYFALDLQADVIPKHRYFYKELRNHGVRTYFTVYDLLPLNMPEYFIPGGDKNFKLWLSCIAESDGVMCISKSVSIEFQQWYEQNITNARALRVNWFHLGADIEISQEIQRLPSNADIILDSINSRVTFLMVGTLEPRKGHSQVLDAIEQIWSMGVDINFVLIGKQGWLVESLIGRLKKHLELNSRLFWLDGVSDDFLNKIYSASSCLIIASFGEGFGLPLIEAAQNKLPIIARDIPVFREVAGEHAFYFSGENKEDLVKGIMDWLDLYEKQQIPYSNEIQWLTWAQSANQLMQLIVGKDNESHYY